MSGEPNVKGVTIKELKATGWTEVQRFMPDEEILGLFPDNGSSVANPLLRRAQAAEAEVTGLRKQLDVTACNPEATADPEAAEPGVPPVVAALAKWLDDIGLPHPAEVLRYHATEITKIIAEHQPPDKLDELLAAAREYERVARFRPQIVQCLDGSGVLVCNAKTAWHEKWLANWDCNEDPAAAIRAATEKLRPKPPKKSVPTDVPTLVKELLRLGFDELAAAMQAIEQPEPEPAPEPKQSCKTCPDRPSCLWYSDDAATELCWRPEIAAPHVWRAPDATTPMDAWVWRASATGPWSRGHYAGEFGCVWGNHLTSWCADGKTDRMCWPRVVLADPAHPDREPPADWTPGAGN